MAHADDVWIIKRHKKGTPESSATYLGVTGRWGHKRLAARFPTAVETVNWARSRWKIEVHVTARTVRASSLYATRDTRAVLLVSRDRALQKAA